MLKTLDEGEAFPGCDALVHLKDVKRLNTYSPEERLYRLQTYFKFVFVREPMIRLLSAYRDKFHPNGSSTSLHGSIGKQIVKRYRRNAGDNITGHDVTWQEFLQYVSNLQGSHFDEHWAPYDDLCQPCVVDYDFIGHHENLIQEANYVIRQMKADHRVAYPARQSYYHNPSLPAELPQKFQTLDAAVRRNLWRIYANSYELFQYNRPAFLTMEKVRMS